MLSDADAEGRRVVTLEIAEEALLKRAVVYDHDGDEHYHVSSALIKSIRGSDPDAAVYWLARMLYAGEDPRFVARRLVISAAEDIGLADPQALTLAQAAADAVSFIGMPEGRIPLAEVAIYLACAPKSNTAYMAINRAMDFVGREKSPPVPIHLKDSGYGSGERLGYGQGYQYPHDFAGGWVQQQYLPDGGAHAVMGTGRARPRGDVGPGGAGAPLSPAGAEPEAAEVSVATPLFGVAFIFDGQDRAGG